MYIHTPPQIISTISLILACGLAFWRGEKPERLAAMLFVLNWTATPILQHFSDRTHFEFTVFAADSAVMAGLIWIALTGDRFWPLWATAFQILDVLMHVAMLIDHKVGGRAYFVGMEISSYLMLLALAVGTLLEAPRSRQAASWPSAADEQRT